MQHYYSEVAHIIKKNKAGISFFVLLNCPNAALQLQVFVPVQDPYHQSPFGRNWVWELVQRTFFVSVVRA